MEMGNLTFFLPARRRKRKYSENCRKSFVLTLILSFQTSWHPAPWLLSPPLRWTRKYFQKSVALIIMKSDCFACCYCSVIQELILYMLPVKPWTLLSSTITFICYQVSQAIMRCEDSLY